MSKAVDVISIDVNVTKLRKERFWKDKNGDLHANLDIVLMKEPGKFGHDFFVAEAEIKEEWNLPKDQKPPKNYVGNGKSKEFGGGTQSQPVQTIQQVQQEQEEDDLPF